MIRFAGPSLNLYLGAGPDFSAGDVVEYVQVATENGVTMVQLRWKSASDLEVVQLARVLKTICDDAQIPLVINDRIDIALAVGASGVHLGVDDLPIEDARHLGGPDFIVGYSPESDSDIATARMRGADYLGIGPFHTTSTKSDAGIALGPQEFSRRRAQTDLPVVAIGGITLGTAESALDAGADGVAVVSAILQSHDPAEATRQLASRINTHQHTGDQDPAHLQDPKRTP